MRLLFTRFPLESAFGGAEIQTLSLMKGLSGRGHAVAFLGSCPILIEETAKLKLPHAKLLIGPPPVTKWNALSFLWRKQKMKERLALALTSFDRIDAIIMISLSEKLLLTEVAVRRGIRVFWMEHDRVGPWLSKNPWLSTLRKLSGTVTTVCVSELSRKIYIDLRWEPDSVVAIANGVDRKRFDATAAHQKPSPQPPSPLLGRGGLLHVGCIARLSPEKGVDVLIQAVGTMPNVQLTIVGTGPDEGYLRKLATNIHDAEMQSAERIRILPRADDLGSFYRSLDALILPSRENDPFGLVTAEAMLCGTPVIVTDQCGIAGYLESGKDAIVVKANSEEALRQGITQLLNTALRSRLSEEGKRTAEQKFSLETMLRNYEKLLEKNRG